MTMTGKINTEPSIEDKGLIEMQDKYDPEDVAEVSE